MSNYFDHLFFSYSQLMDADSSGSYFVHRDYEMTDDELESKCSPDLMSEDCSKPAASEFDNEPIATEPGYVSSCDSASGHLSRSHTLVPPLISLPPLYASSTQHQQDDVGAQLSSGVTFTVQ